MKRFLLVGLMCCCSFSSVAVVVTEQQLVANRALVDALPLADDMTPDTIVQTAQPLSDAQQALWLQRVLQTLPRQPDKVNMSLQRWVKTLRHNPLALEIENPDHPGQLIVVNSVANLASALVHQWQVRQQASDLDDAWQAGNWSWQAIDAMNTQRHAALVHWFSELGSADAQVLAEGFLQLPQKPALPDNQALVVLSQQASSQQLAHYVLTRTPDQFSTRMLSALNAWFSTAQQIQILTSALEHDAYASLALNHLAPLAVDSEMVRQRLQAALQDPSRMWFATSALSRIPDKALQKRLYETLPATQRKLKRFAAQQMPWVDEQ